MRALHRRLRILSLVLPRPKEGEGDSLQVAFQVEDPAAGAGLLAALGLADVTGLQRPVAGPFAGAEVQAGVHRHPADEHGDPRYGESVALIRLWNAAAPYDITPDLVRLAAAIERNL